MNVLEVAALSHLSKRALHYYDDIGLLRPKRQDENGYREYDEDDLKRLEQILLYREMEFPLKDIARILDGQKADTAAMMKKHKAVLTAKRERLDRILELIEKRIKGEKAMDFEAFDERAIESAKAKYEAEAKARWGNTDAYRESSQRTQKYTKEDWDKISEEADAICRRFYEMKDLKPDDKKRLVLAEAWRRHINIYYYDCTYEILSGLGQMYVADERFTQTIDQFGEGTAKAMSESIQVLCEQKINND